jgi:hypothetical protein
VSAVGRALLRRADLELTDGEHVLWIGRPEERATVRYSMRVAIVPVVALAVAGIGYVLDVWGMLLGDAGAAVRRTLSPSAVEIAGAVLVFLGMVLAGATLWGKWITGTTWYAVTNRRLLFLHGRTAASHWLGTYDFMTVQIDDHGDGTGDLLFRRTRAGYDRETGRAGTAVPDLFTELGQSIAGDADEQEVDVAFCGIRNAPAVRELILRAYASVR